jgi:WD40 repeat protein
VALNANGDILASAFVKTIWICDAKTGKELPAPERPLFTFSPVIARPIFSLDCKSLLWNGRDGRIEFWSLERHTTTRIIIEPWLLEDPTQAAGSLVPRGDRTIVPFERLALSGNGKIVAAATVDGTVQLWEAETGRHLGELGDRFSKRQRVSLRQVFDENVDEETAAERLAKTFPDGAGLELPTAYEMWHVPDNYVPTIWFVGLDFAGKNAIVHVGDRVLCCDVATRKEWLRIENCSHSAMTPAGDTLFCQIEPAGKIICIDVAKRVRTGEFTGKWPIPRIFGLKLLPDARYLLIECSDSTIRAVRLADGVVLAKYHFDDRQEVIDDWAVSARGNRMAVRWRDLGTRIWDIDFRAAGRR